jgi:hypothetical protein
VSPRHGTNGDRSARARTGLSTACLQAPTAPRELAQRRAARQPQFLPPRLSAARRAARPGPRGPRRLAALAPLAGRRRQRQRRHRRRRRRPPDATASGSPFTAAAVEASPALRGVLQDGVMARWLLELAATARSFARPCRSPTSGEVRAPPADAAAAARSRPPRLAARAARPERRTRAVPPRLPGARARQGGLGAARATPGRYLRHMVDPDAVRRPARAPRRRLRARRACRLRLGRLLAARLRRRSRTVAALLGAHRRSAPCRPPRSAPYATLPPGGVARTSRGALGASFPGRRAGVARLRDAHAGDPAPRARRWARSSSTSPPARSRCCSCSAPTLRTPAGTRRAASGARCTPHRRAGRHTSHAPAWHRICARHGERSG